MKKVYVYNKDQQVMGWLGFDEQPPPVLLFNQRIFILLKEHYYECDSISVIQLLPLD